MSSYRPHPPPALARDAHKGLAGRVLCACGSADMPGAAVLVARAAQRAGGGLVCVGWTFAGLRSILAVAASEAVSLDLSDPTVRREKLSASQWDAIALGPG